MVIDRKATKESDTSPGRGRLRLFLVALDVLGAAAWTYLLIKVFVTDVDRIVLQAVAPSLLFLVDYRLAIYLTLIVLAAILLRGKPLLAALYVLGFPLVIAFWKFPAFLFRHRSWPLFLGLLQAAVAIFSDLRYQLATKSLAVIALIVIVFSDATPLIILSGAYLVFLAFWSFVRLFRRTFTAPPFTAVQRSWIRTALRSNRLRSVMSLDEEYRRPGIERFSDMQAQQVMLTISVAVGACKALHLWAYQLDRYRRRYAPALLFNALSFAWVFVGSMFTLALINLSVLKADPAQYELDGPSSFIAVLMYSLSTMALGEAGGIRPVGEVALLVQFLSGLLGLLVLGSVVLNLVLTARRERDDTSTQDLVTELRSHAREQERCFTDEYTVSADEAKRRLEQIGYAFAGVLAYLTNAVPAEFAGEVRGTDQ